MKYYTTTEKSWFLIYMLLYTKILKMIASNWWIIVELFFTFCIFEIIYNSICYFIIEQSIFNRLVEQGSQSVTSKFLFWQFSIDLQEVHDLLLKSPSLLYMWTCLVTYMLTHLGWEIYYSWSMTLWLEQRMGGESYFGFRYSHCLWFLWPIWCFVFVFFFVCFFVFCFLYRGTLILVSSCFPFPSETCLEIQWANVPYWIPLMQHFRFSGPHLHF